MDNPVTECKHTRCGYNALMTTGNCYNCGAEFFHGEWHKKRPPALTISDDIPTVYDDLPEAPTQQIERAYDLANKFISSTNHYASCKGIARVAITDFILSSQGFKLPRKE